MRIHTDTLTYEQIETAANRAAVAGHGRVYVDEATQHGSRSRAHAWNVKLIGDGSHSRRRTNSGTHFAARGTVPRYAATYDSWGEFLAVVFHYDPRAIAGPYNGVEDFERQTSGKYPVPAHIL